MKIRKLPEETTGPLRHKKKKPKKIYTIEKRYNKEWFQRDSFSMWEHRDWRVWRRYAKELDRDHELGKHRRSWWWTRYLEFRAGEDNG